MTSRGVSVEKAREKADVLFFVPDKDPVARRAARRSVHGRGGVWSNFSAGTRKTVTTATTAATTTASAEAPALPASLAGRWKLNLEASDNLDALIDKLGGGFIEKQAAKTLSRIHVFTPLPGGCSIHVSSAFQDKTDRLVFDGRTVVLGKAVKMTSKTTHRLVGDSIVSTTHMNGDGVAPFVTVTTRKREGARLIMTIEVKDPAQPIVVRRVFDPVA